MMIDSINILSVVVAAVVAFAIGGVWYGPLFGAVWMKANGFTEEDLRGRKMAVVFVGSFLLSLVASVVLAAFIGPDASAGFGAAAGLSAGLGWVATFTGIQYLFEKKRPVLFLVNAGYSVVTLTAMGAILGMWAT